DLEALRRELRPEGGSNDPHPARAVSVYGAGGLGKTRIVIEFAHRYREHYPGGVHFLVVLERTPLDVWADLGRQLAPDTSNDLQAAELAYRQLESATDRTLVVLDDVVVSATAGPDRFARPMALGPRQARALPATPLLHLLVTTRHRDLPGTRPVHLERLDREAALALLLQRAERAPKGQEHDAALALADQDLGGHALGVSLAGAYLRKAVSVSFATYRRQLAETGLVHKLEDAAQKTNAVWDHDPSVARTIALSTDQLDRSKRQDVLAWTVLSVAAELAPGTPIDRPLAYRTVRRVEAETGDEELDLALDRLLDLALVTATQ